MKMKEEMKIDMVGSSLGEPKFSRQALKVQLYFSGMSHGFHFMYTRAYEQKAVMIVHRNEMKENIDQ